MTSLTAELSAIAGRAFEAEGFAAALGTVNASDRPDLAQFQCNGALAAAKLAAQGDADSYWRTKIGLAHVFAENVLARAPSLAAAIQMGADDLTATSPQALGATT